MELNKLNQGRGVKLQTIAVAWGLQNNDSLRLI